MHLVKDGGTIVRYGWSIGKDSSGYDGSRDHWLLVQSLYFVIVFCTVYRGIRQTKHKAASKKTHTRYHRNLSVLP